MYEKCDWNKNWNKAIYHFLIRKFLIKEERLVQVKVFEQN